MAGVVATDDQCASLARELLVSAQTVAVIPKTDTAGAGGGVNADMFG